MSRSIQMLCAHCGKDITMAGSVVCDICDPIQDYLSGKSSGAPLCCQECFPTQHEHVTKTAAGESGANDSTDPIPTPL